ncbi:MAG: hypothetical protein HS115_14710 [Spirochaetales bacterium]|nr:hypothetical protein [Spirochaetales bacterium]
MRISVLILLLYACTPAGPEITDDLVVRYIQAYQNVRRIAPELARKMAAYKGEGEAGVESAGTEGFEELQKAVQSAGFKDMAEFVAANAKIAWAFNYVQAERAIGEFQKMHDNGLEEFDRALADPEVPEETKAALRDGRAKLAAEFARSKSWADLTMRGVRLFSDEKARAVIERHREALEKAYMGLPGPEGRPES